MTRARTVLGAVAVAGAVAGGVAIGVACTGGADKVTGSGGLVSIVITPDTATLVVGTTRSFTAQPEDGSGKPIAGVTVIWASGDTSLATVTQSGVVTALKPGTVQIAAAAQGVNGYATVTVTPVPVASVVVAPSAAMVRVGKTVQLTDTLKDAKGNVLTGAVTWAAGDTTIAKVSTTGLVTAIAVGTTQVTASASGKSAAAAITVTLVPVASVKVTPATDTLVIAQQVTLVASAFDSLGNALTGRIASWSSNNTAVASVTAAGGLVTGNTVGTASITATIEGITASALVTVNQPPVASIAISPHPASVAISGIATLTATLKDARGDTLTGRTLAWKSSDATTVSVGTFTGQQQTVTGHTAAAPPAWLAWTVPVSVPASPNGTFGEPRTMLNPRQLQFSVKFSF